MTDKTIIVDDDVSGFGPFGPFGIAAAVQTTEFSSRT
jgi:hypothetical protein